MVCFICSRFLSSCRDLALSHFHKNRAELFKSQAKLHSFLSKCWSSWTQLGPLLPLGAYVQDLNPATTFGYLNSLISKRACDMDRPLSLVPRSPTKGARTDATTTALGGGGHQTEGHESRTWHSKPFVPAVAGLGTSAPVLPGCWARGMWSVDCGWACGPGGQHCQQMLYGTQEGGRKEPHWFFTKFSSILSSQVLTLGLFLHMTP
jgi:hypothetical protein